MALTDNAADVRVVAPLISPICLDCGVPMRLARITPHDMRDDAEIRAYACDCGHEVVQMVSLWPLKAIALPAP